ncbi:ribosome biogenesis GTPase Der [Patescibacteria group bacterium]
MKKLPKVVIIGRTNVGKSTLFNRLIEKPKALTSKLAGTTRDLNIDQVYWQGINFELLDSGGIESIIPSKKLKKISPELNVEYALDIIRRTQVALKEADLILFLVDIQAGLLPQDKELSKALKKLNKEIIFVANKTDSMRHAPKIAEFYKLSLAEPILVSAINGLGTGDLLDEVVKKLKKIKKVRKAKKFSIKDTIKITLIGKPNVGKSSLLNALLGEDRVIVSPIPFTTREAIDTYLEYNKQAFTIIDTAGVRKQAKINKGLEKISARKSLTNAKKSDICLLVLDIAKPITIQDNKLSKILLDAKVNIVIVANKWDKIPDKDTKSQKEYEKYVYKHFPYLTWAPIIFVSALTGKAVHQVLDLALQVNKARTVEIPDNALGRFLKQAIKKHKPTKAKGTRNPRLIDLKQIKTNPPKFQLRISKNDTLNPSYIKYLKNTLREKFNLPGTPLEIIIKQ